MLKAMCIPWLSDSVDILSLGSRKKKTHLDLEVKIGHLHKYTFFVSW